MTGTISKLHRDKGYGFIMRDDPPSPDQRFIFFHKSGVLGGYYDHLEEKVTKVEFSEEETDKGPRAFDVSIL